MTFRVVLAVVVNVYAIVLFVMLSDLLRESPRWKISLWTRLAAIGGWEILLGTFICTIGPVAMAIGPFGLGLVFVCAPLVRAQVVRKLHL